MLLLLKANQYSTFLYTYVYTPGSQSWLGLRIGIGRLRFRWGNLFYITVMPLDSYTPVLSASIYE